MVCPSCQFKNASRSATTGNRVCECCGSVLPYKEAPGLLEKLVQLAQFGLTTGPLLEPHREND